MNQFDLDFYKIVGKKLRELRISSDYTLNDIAEKVSLTPKTIQRYELGERKIDAPKLKEIVEALDYDYDSFIIEVQIAQTAHLKGSPVTMLKSKKKGVTINVLGRVAAGVPIEAIEDIIDTEDITEDMAKTGEFFGLQIHGDSMEPRICEKDIVIVRQQEDAESGDIVIAMVNGSDATCKRLVKYAEGISLTAFNSKYEPMFFSNKEIEEKPVKIIGKVVELRAKFDF